MSFLWFLTGCFVGWFTHIWARMYLRERMRAFEEMERWRDDEAA